MLRKILILLFFGVQSAAAAELSYNDIKLSFGTGEARDEPEFDFDGWSVAARKLVSGPWFIEGSYSRAESEWSGVDVPLPCVEICLEWPLYDVRVVTRPRSLQLGGGRYWQLGEDTHFTAAAYATYNEFESHESWTATVPEESMEVRSDESDVGYRVELGLRSLLTDRLEAFGLLAHTEVFDDSGLAYHAGLRFRAFDRFDLEGRYVRTEDVDGLWAGVIWRY